MKDAYERRYLVPFHDVVGPTVDRRAFVEARPVAICSGNTTPVVYTGNLAWNRWRSALDMAKVVHLLGGEGWDISFVCYSLSAPSDAVADLERLGAVVREPVPVSQVPGIVKSAGILFLPEGFDEKVGRWTSLSLSSKVPYYVMARRPIVVYGSALSGVVRHAQAEGWGTTVTEPSLQRLADSVRDILTGRLQFVWREEVLARYDAREAKSRMFLRMCELRKECDGRDAHAYVNTTPS